MYAFSQDNLYAIGALTQDDDVQGLPRCGDTNRDLLGIHAIFPLLP